MRLTGLLMAILAGAAMSVQGVMNTRLGERIGFLESNAFVQGTAFLLSAIAVLLLGRGNFKALADVNKLYWLGGALGLAITLTVMVSIKALSPTIAISAILISQLLVAALIDAFGLLEAEKVAFGVNKYLGLVLMIVGVIVFKRR
jgi:transporter family-2 protein